MLLLGSSFMKTFPFLQFQMPEASSHFFPLTLLLLELA